MTTRTHRMLVLGLALALVGGACQDLDNITNPNNPDRERALAVPGDVETLIASSWYPYWNRTQVQGSVYHPANAISGIMSTSVADNGGLLLSEIPRTSYDNNPSSDMQGFARFPWYDFYTGLDSSNEGLRAIAEGLEVGDDGEDTERARAWGKFAQGLNLMLLGLFFDQAFIVTEENLTQVQEELSAGTPVLDVLEFHPYPEVIDAATASFTEAADIAGANSFTIPPEWLRLVDGISSDRLARLAHSMAARALVLSARTPAERDALDWSRVFNHLDQGITQDVYVDHDRDELGSSNYKRRIMANFFNGFFFSQFFLAYADVSGNSQAWLSTPVQERQRVHISTPDQRILTGDSTSDGKYVQYRPTNNFRDERGVWRQSYYQLDRRADMGYYRDDELLIMSTVEMDLYRAEGLARTGQTQAAADLANATRTVNGELPPLTAAGVPDAADCVPRYYDGTCMNLVDAILYERVLETTGMESPRDWMEARGWGHLVEGTILHLPVPGRELETLGLPLYTFGGGGEGSAPGR